MKPTMERITNQSSESKSLDISDANIEQLKQIFPEVFIQGKINFEALKDALGESIDNSEESYQFSWNGKSKAKQIARTPSTGTLRPCIEDSINWDSTENLFIEGDNLEVLKLLQKSYHKQVKMIYIDPPYNTGKDFVYKDNFQDNIKNYLEVTKQVDNEGNQLSSNTETSGRFHSDWLNMIYPRLKLARNLLKKDGVIFISIDDNEINNLTNVCNEIFGEENVDVLIWNKEAEGSSGTLKQTLRYRRVHEYIVLCYKSKAITKFNRISTPISGKEDKFDTANLAVNSDKTKEGHPNWMELTSPTGIKWYEHWKFDNTEINRLIDEDLLYWGSDGTRKPRLIIPYDHRRKIYSLSIIEKGGTTQGRRDLESILGEGIFDNPKPLTLLSHLMKMLDLDNEIVLDFFSGSGSTADALIRLNAEDKKNRKFILIQLPEPINKSVKAYDMGFKKISDITRERIRISNQENKGDGFKVLKLDSTNIKPWDADFDDPQAVFLNSIESIKDGRKDDVLYEVLLKYGIELTTDIEEELIDGKKVYVIGAGALVVCLDDEITTSLVESICKLEQVEDSETTQVVFKDAGFADSTIKTNAVQILKQAGIEDVKSL